MSDSRFPRVDASAPRLAWYGDDFTGATDTLATVAQRGWRSVLFLGVPGEAEWQAAGPLDAVGIAGATRSMTPDEMRQELAPVAQFMKRIGARVLHYKCCSTFDSAAEVGNLAVATGVLLSVAASPWLPIVAGQPNIGRYSAFGHLFARAGAEGDVYRLDRHPTMSHHPVTPMTEADLREHLTRQGLRSIGLLPYVEIDAALAEPSIERQDARQDAHLTTYLERHRASLEASPPTLYGVRPLLIDIASERHVQTVGRLLWRMAGAGPMVVLGASSVAQCLIDGADEPQQTLSQQNCEPATATVPAPALHAIEARTDPTTDRTGVLVFVGSLSPVTQQQVEAARGLRHIAVDGDRLARDANYANGKIEEIADALANGQHVLAQTAKPAGPVVALDARRIAKASAALVAAVVASCSARQRPLRRIGVAGGDTSSYAVQALPLWGLQYGGQLSPGVTLSIGRSHDPLLDGIELMLKGGQMGHAALFDDFVAGGPLTQQSLVDRTAAE